MKQLESMADCSEWLAQGDRPEQLDVLRRHVGKGLPCEAEALVR